MSSSQQVRAREKRRTWPLTVAGLVVLLAGLGCLGYVGYQLLGTSFVSQRAFDSEKDSLRDQWQQEATTPVTTPAPSGPTTKKAPSAGSTKSPNSRGDQGASEGARAGSGGGQGAGLALLRIPAFGSDYEVPILAGTDLDTLSRGVGHYSTTALPGQVGNFAVAGHRITHGQPFARLLDLKKGDQVVVETATAIYTYVIDEPPSSITVQASASWVLDAVPGKPRAAPTSALITLTTCQDLFQSSDRSIGFGHLASTTNKG